MFKNVMTGSDICPSRITQPEELAFVFMRVMDEISKASKKTKTISKQQTTTSLKKADSMGATNTEEAK